ncbi:Spy/CpxP family protein refolding chaperone [uncultured Abyssibacter sp.]|uniref:Spy/CpxP family protein refolding chaperone n=1 Tax=uncultured Abyssibacter sp. TaxID=2320202 RepID=UPI0032B294E7|tara:strand:- start:53 stop:505 length:453 start_codon:yes stop_codon:yes gene_type:complete
MKRLITIALVSLSAMTMLSTPAMARPDHEGGYMKHMFRGLDLTDEQKSQIDGIMEANRPQSQDLRERTRSLHDKMTALDPTASGYQTQVQGLANEAAELKREQVLHGSELRRQVAQVLTPEQRAEMKERAAEKREKFRERAEQWMEKKGR